MAPTMTVGSRAQVMHGTALKTSGNLKKKDLMYKNGGIISRKASATAEKRFKGALKKAFEDNRAKPFTTKTAKAAAKKSAKARK